LSGKKQHENPLLPFFILVLKIEKRLNIGVYMTDIVLVYPPVSFPDSSSKKRSFGLPPLGIYYLSSYLNARGVKTIVIDAEINNLSLYDTISTIIKYSPKLIGVSGMTIHYGSIKLIINALVKRRMKCPIVLGGPHFSATKGEVLRDVKGADFVIAGEAEESLFNLYRRRDFTSIGGLSYRGNGKIHTNAAVPLQVPIDELPFPDLRDSYKPTNYRVRYGKSDKAMSIMASRGCPFQCTFCDVYVTQGRRLRLRSAENIVEEIRFNMNTFGISEFIFKDSTFTVNKIWVSQLVDKILRENIRISWSINTRVDMVDNDKFMLRNLKAAGVRKISFGVESGDQKVLDSIKKGITLEQAKEAFKLTKRAKIETHAFFMIGNPGETKESAEKTIRFSKQLEADWAAFAPTIVYPGTEMYREAVAMNYLKDEKWYLNENVEIFMSNIGSISKGQMHLPGFSPKEQLLFTKKAYRKFYLRPKWLIATIARSFNLNLIRNILKSLPEFLFFSAKKG